MRCADCRESISARLDGEATAAGEALVEEHLGTCAQCRAFAESAARINRLARTGLAEPPDDGVLDAVLASPEAARLTAWRGPRLRVALPRVALAAVGVGQIGLAVSELLVSAGSGDPHGAVELAGASAAHFVNESAAWNLALGVAFTWVATSRARPAAALLAVVTSFVAVLTAMSVTDLVAGRVEPGRLAVHGLVVAGLVLLVVVRAVVTGDGDRARVRPPAPGPTGTDVADPLASPPRTGDGDDLRPSARRAA